jgi:predicted nuclease of predicted toxin-antitoxin system
MTDPTDDELAGLAGTLGAPRVMLLVDADNVSADVIEQAMAEVRERHGAIHVRRAYCTAETAVKHARTFERLALRPMVNLTAGKNANDIALAIDAMDLAATERPDVAVIVSSDSDFAPLAIRLREKGCRVEGFGQTGKTARHDKPAYDDFTDLSHRKAKATGEAGRKAAGTARAAKAGDEAAKGKRGKSARIERSVDEGESDKPAARPADKASGKSPKAAGRGRKSDAGRPAAASAPARVPTDVEQILNAVPSLRDGRELELGNVAERLRTAGLLGKNAASTRLFGKHRSHFVLVPEGNPNRVRWIGVAAARPSGERGD